MKNSANYGKYVYNDKYDMFKIMADMTSGNVLNPSVDGNDLTIIKALAK